MLSKWKGSSSSLSVGDEARPRLPVRDLAFAALPPLDSYLSEPDNDCASDVRDGGLKRCPDVGKLGDFNFHPDTSDCVVRRLTLDCSSLRFHSGMP